MSWEKRSREPVPKVAKGDSGYKVWLSVEARRQINSLDLGSGVECGGALFGGIDGKEIWVADFCAASTYATSRSMGLDLEYIDRQAERHQQYTGWGVVGTFHSHPGSGEVEPSSDDLISWRSFHRHYGERPFIGMVLARADFEPPAWAWGSAFGGVIEGTWNHPTAGVYIIERGSDPAGCLIRGAADLTVEPEPVPSWR